MATVIRFARHGSKKRPYYRIVVQHQLAKRDGRYIEHIGAYNPISGDDSLVIKRERLEYWLSVGAQMSDSVKNRLKLFKKNEGKQREDKPAPPQTPEVKATAASPAPSDVEKAPPSDKPASEATKSSS